MLLFRMRRPALCAWYLDMNLFIPSQTWWKLLHLLLRMLSLRSSIVGDMLAMCIYVVPMMWQFVFLLMLPSRWFFALCLCQSGLNRCTRCDLALLSGGHAGHWPHEVLYKLGYEKAVILGVDIDSFGMWHCDISRVWLDIFRSVHESPDLLRNGLHPNSLVWHPPRSLTPNVWNNVTLIVFCGLGVTLQELGPLLWFCWWFVHFLWRGWYSGSLHAISYSLAASLRVWPYHHLCRWLLASFAEALRAALGRSSWCPRFMGFCGYRGDLWCPSKMNDFVCWVGKQQQVRYQETVLLLLGHFVLALLLQSVKGFSLRPYGGWVAMRPLLLFFAVTPSFPASRQLVQQAAQKSTYPLHSSVAFSKLWRFHASWSSFDWACAWTQRDPLMSLWMPWRSRRVPKAFIYLDNQWIYVFGDMSSRISGLSLRSTMDCPPFVVKASMSHALSSGRKLCLVSPLTSLCHLLYGQVLLGSSALPLPMWLHLDLAKVVSKESLTSFELNFCFPFPLPGCSRSALLWRYDCSWPSSASLLRRLQRILGVGALVQPFRSPTCMWMGFQFSSRQATFKLCFVILDDFLSEHFLETLRFSWLSAMPRRVESVWLKGRNGGLTRRREYMILVRRSFVPDDRCQCWTRWSRWFLCFWSWLSHQQRHCSSSPISGWSSTLSPIYAALHTGPRHTWLSPDGIGEFCIDFVAVPRSFLSSCTWSQTLPDFDLGQLHVDHIAVGLELRWKQWFSAPTRSPGVTAYNRDRIKRGHRCAVPACTTSGTLARWCWRPSWWAQSTSLYSAYSAVDVHVDNTKSPSSQTRFGQFDRTNSTIGDSYALPSNKWGVKHLRNVSLPGRPIELSLMSTLRMGLHYDVVNSSMQRVYFVIPNGFVYLYELRNGLCLPRSSRSSLTMLPLLLSCTSWSRSLDPPMLARKEFSRFPLFWMRMLNHVLIHIPPERDGLTSLCRWKLAAELTMGNNADFGDSIYLSLASCIWIFLSMSCQHWRSLRLPCDAPSQGKQLDLIIFLLSSFTISPQLWPGNPTLCSWRRLFKDKNRCSTRGVGFFPFGKGRAARRYVLLTAPFSSARTWANAYIVPCVWSTLEYMRDICKPNRLAGRRQTPVGLGVHQARAFQRHHSAHGRSTALIFLDLTEAFYRVVRQLALPLEPSDELLAHVAEKLQLDGDALRDLHDLIADPCAVREARLPEHAQRAFAALHQDTHFSLHGQTDRCVTRLGSRPGDAFADVIFGFLMGEGASCSSVPAWRSWTSWTFWTSHRPFPFWRSAWATIRFLWFCWALLVRWFVRLH